MIKGRFKVLPDSGSNDDKLTVTCATGHASDKRSFTVEGGV